MHKAQFPSLVCWIIALLITPLATGVAQSPQAQSPSASALVYRAFVENKNDLNALRNYLFTTDVSEVNFDKNDQPNKARTTHSEVFFIDGEPVERVLLENGQPLAEKERRKQEKEIDEQMADAASPNPKHREERQKQAAKALGEEIELREDVANAYTFTMLDKELCLGDHHCTRLAAEPRADFKGKSRYRELLPLLHGTLLIDTDSGQWVDIDAVMVRKLGGGLLYIGGESNIHLHQDPVAEDLWVLTRADVRLNVRLFWAHKNVRIVATGRDFKRFGSSTRMVPTEPDAAKPTAEPPASTESTTKPDSSKP
jgi:hypothetical protein